MLHEGLHDRQDALRIESQGMESCLWKACRWWKVCRTAGSTTHSQIVGVYVPACLRPAPQRPNQHSTGCPRPGKHLLSTAHHNSTQSRTTKAYFRPCDRFSLLACLIQMPLPFSSPADGLLRSRAHGHFHFPPRPRGGALYGRCDRNAQAASALLCATYVSSLPTGLSE
ncbi:hypothetical protein VUR80DRAFT_7144 [Thermomyces stellatus]